MRSLAILLLVLPFAAVSARASACAGGTASQAHALKPLWVLDHYVFDAALKEDWAVLVDCNHPAAPAQMKLASNILGKGQVTQYVTASHSKKPALVRIPSATAAEIKSGTAVEVLNGANQPASILLSGTAMETAFFGQPIRVRLSVDGRFVTGLVRGPHSVELAAAKLLWGEP